MTMGFQNVYEDEERARAYADLEFPGTYYLAFVLSAFTFDNIPLRPGRVDLFRELSHRLAPDGRIVNLVSSEQIYLNEWLSFSTRDFPENKNARSGDRVRITMLDVPDRRPVEDIAWTELDYAETFAAAGLDVLEVHRPLGNDRDPFTWVSECAIAPWTIHVLEPKKSDSTSPPTDLGGL